MPVVADFAVMSPGLRWSLGNVQLPGGVDVVRLPKGQRPNFSADLYITEDQKERLSACEYWLVQELPAAQQSVEAIQESIQNLLNTQIAFQVILPRESELIFLTRSRSQVYRALEPPRWPRMLWPSNTASAEMMKVVEGVQAAFKTVSVRLKNPLYFLELGLQNNNPSVRSFLWTTGIDSLLVANSEGKFKRRISNLLGQTHVYFRRMGVGGILSNSWPLACTSCAA